jgi:hypothetical protein
MNIGTCIGCQQEKPIKAKGYCRACYQQWKRTGSTSRERMPRGQCTVPGCEKMAHGRGICEMHIKRMKVSGSYDDPRADNVNLKTNQAAYVQWMTYRRGDGYPIVQEWFDDFFVFFAAVGERPSPQHRLNRIDKTKPMGPGNFEWREKFTTRQADEGTLEYNNRYRKVRKETVGHSMWKSDLQRKYGIDDARHQAMYAAQNGLCAISGLPEDRTRGNGESVYLATDHEDRPDGTKLVRQLIRGACNTAIGLMDHDPFMLAKAILYLAKHDPDGRHAGQQKVDAVVEYLKSWPVADLDQDAILPQIVRS